MTSKTERIRKLRNLTVDRGATEAEADTATRIADELEATLSDAEKEDRFIAEAQEEVYSYERQDDYRGTVYRQRVWYAEPTGGIYIESNPIPSSEFASRIRRRSPFG